MISRAKRSLAVLTVASLIAFCGSVAAQETGFYAGASIGQAEFKDSCDGLTGISGLSCDEKDTAWKIFGGYQFNPHLSAEFGYANLGETFVSDATDRLAIEVTLWELVGVGAFPVVDKFSIYGKVGVYRAETELSSTIPGVNADDSNTGITFGVGVRYDFTRNLGVRAEWQQYDDVGSDDTGEGDINVLSISLIWKF